jgi:hypothetical protein
MSNLSSFSSRNTGATIGLLRLQFQLCCLCASQVLLAWGLLLVEGQMVQRLGLLLDELV